MALCNDRDVGFSGPNVQDYNRNMGNPAEAGIASELVKSAFANVCARRSKIHICNNTRIL